jgi:hypothetical protein
MGQRADPWAEEKEVLTVVGRCVCAFGGRNDGKSLGPPARMWGG